MASRWRMATLGALVQLQRGYDLTDAERSPGSVPVLGGGGPNGTHATANVKGPGVAIGRSGAGFGKAWWSDRDYWAHNTVLFVKDFNGNDPRYVYYVLDSIDFGRFNSGGAQPSLNRNFIYPIELPIPPFREQKQIARMLKTWDEAIDKEARVLGMKERLYSWLAETLLVVPTLKLRSKRTGAATPLSHHTKELTERNADNALGRDLVMGVSNANGIVPMREQTIGSDLTRYKILPPKAFAYNPMRINVGSIAMSRLKSDVLVSPDYVLFACRKGLLDPDYFDHLCGTHWWKHHMNESGSGSVRQRIYYEDLAALRVVIPPFEKQRQIANCLNQAKREIELIEAQIAALTKQKRGLMQKLLTGQWRVKADGDVL